MSRDVRLVAVPWDSAIRGWRMGAGPLRLLESGLEDHLRARGHAVETRWIEAPAAPPPAEIRTAFQLAASIADAVREARTSGALPVILAGNCISSIGTLAGLGAPAPAVIWLDAHADFNTPETTRSGFLDGMSLAIATGRCWTALSSTLPGWTPIPDANVCLVGTRDIDPPEADLLRASTATVLPPDELAARLSPTLDALRSRAESVYLHVDLDVLDPREGRANAFAVPGGLLLPQVLELITEVRRSFRIGAVALTAYDPALDPDARIPAAAQTIL
ncbi:MAG TPA: arginase family protein, partial [Longimicrobium sp.]|nr:arginase family protein [Longimicrobium sp.]